MCKRAKEDLNDAKTLLVMDFSVSDKSSA